ncbi:MAG: murein L,D-transpeptidase catalytic domain-containing protein [Pseudomonadota bacterium]
MPLDSVVGNVSYYGGFAWVYGIKKDLWDAAVRSYVKNFDRIEKPFLITLVDYRIPRNEKRMWVLNFAPGMPQLVVNTWCAHGTGSGGLNATEVGQNDRKSCVGGFVTAHTWKSHLGQKNKSGTKTKLAMCLHGLDPTNDRAKKRGIRWHGAHYVKPGWVGNSWGCVCPPQDVHDKLVKPLSGGSFLFTYFGEDHIEV